MLNDVDIHQMAPETQGCDPEQTAPSKRSAAPEQAVLSKQEKVFVNQLLTSLFDSITRIEEASLNNRLTQDLTIAELHTIAAIGLYESVPMKTIAHRLGVTLATVTVAVNKLAAKGHVSRERCSTDRRQVLVSLTTAGRKAWRAHDAFHRKMTEGALAGLSSDEAHVLVKALGRVKDFFEGEEQVLASKNDR